MPRPRKPVSQKQPAANRANAAKSTGPRTPQGKARSAQNSRKHGFSASTFAVVRLEDLNEVAHLRGDLIALDHPGNPVIFMDAELSGNGDIEITRAQNRHYCRAVEEFDRLKALRQELPGEPNYHPQPEPKEPLNPTAHEPVSTPNPAPEDAGFPERPLADAPTSDSSRDRQGAVASESSVAPRVPGSTHSSEHYPAATRQGADLIGSTPRDQGAFP